MENPLPPLFIAIDGIDGTGKTTIAKHLCEKLSQYNYNVEYLPLLGTGELGQLIRKEILNNKLSITSECVYMATAVLDVLTNILPNKLMQPNTAIVMDRYISSFYAYQFLSVNSPLAGTIYAHCLKEAYYERLPDWYIMTQCSPSIANDRIAQRKLLLEENNAFDHINEQRKEKIREAMNTYHQKSVVNYKTVLNTDEELPLVKQKTTRALKNFLVNFLEK